MKWAFDTRTDRREATLVLEFVAGLLDNPDIGHPIVSGEAFKLRHYVPEGTATDVIWGFDPATRWIDVFAPGIDDE